jgi:CubicO group peptidase (beta-lactamase class C family)
MARFGYLYLREGKWKDTQVIPADWVKESTTSYSDVAKSGRRRWGGGYGYLWWVNGFGLPVKTFNAWGALGKYIVVIPERDMVAAYQNHTELPDDALAMSDEDVNKLPTISAPQINTLLKMLVDAQCQALRTRALPFQIRG